MRLLETFCTGCRRNINDIAAVLLHVLRRPAAPDEARRRIRRLKPVEFINRIKFPMPARPDSPGGQIAAEIR